MKKHLSLLLATSILFGCGSSDDNNTITNIIEDAIEDTVEDAIEDTVEDVIEDTISDTACSVDSATIFTECLSSVWAITMWDSISESISFGLNGTTDNATWSIVDLDDGVHDNVIDIQILQTTGFSDFAFRSVVESTEDLNSIDLTEYENGYFVFDLKILDYGQSELGIFTHFQCGWPCRSQYLSLANLSGENLIAEVDQWVTIRLPMQSLTADNLSETAPDLDLSLVNALIIGPAHDSETEQTGVHFQLDNIRFETED